MATTPDPTLHSLWRDRLRRQKDRLDELNAVHHLLGLDKLPDEGQGIDDLTDGATVLGAIRDARMRVSPSGQYPKKSPSCVKMTRPRGKA